MKGVGSLRTKTQPPIYSTILLILAIVVIFVIPVFPQDLHRVLYNVAFTALIIFGALSMDRGRGTIYKVAAAAIVFEWLAGFFNLEMLVSLSRLFLLGFFVMIVIGMISQVARTQRVTVRVITESIIGYLLLGIVFSLITMLVAAVNPEAFNFPFADSGSGGIADHQVDFVYYAFVTFATLGYGDMLPVAPYAKSVAILAAVSGQIYLTVIIAMLVGKFLSHSRDQQ